MKKKKKKKTLSISFGWRWGPKLQKEGSGEIRPGLTQQLAHPAMALGMALCQEALGHAIRNL